MGKERRRGWSRTRSHGRTNVGRTRGRVAAAARGVRGEGVREMTGVREKNVVQGGRRARAWWAEGARLW
jgi:hypothetical protein